jgi:hypothetical protein
MLKLENIPEKSERHLNDKTCKYEVAKGITTTRLLQPKLSQLINLVNQPMS